MIKNDQQFAIACQLESDLSDFLRNFAERHLGNAEGSAKPDLSDIRAKLQDVQADIESYRDIRSGKVTNLQASNLQDLPDILIGARIARHMTQSQLGDYVGLKMQQIQAYEAERYATAQLSRLLRIANALGVNISLSGQVVGSGNLHSVAAADWSAFPISEMYKRGWFEEFAGSLPQAHKVVSRLLETFFRRAGMSWPLGTDHCKSVRTQGLAHEAAITAWEARVSILADRNAPTTGFKPASVTPDWLRGLVALSARRDGPKRAPQYLRDIGIVPIFEPQLPGMALDGASLRTSRGTAVVALTLRHPTFAHFWSTLLHQIGHLKFHIRPGEFDAIFDDGDTEPASVFEEDTDVFAREALLSTEKWRKCESRVTETEAAVLADAKRLKLGPWVIAGRMHRDANDARFLRGFLRAGDVRELWAECRGTSRGRPAHAGG